LELGEEGFAEAVGLAQRLRVVEVAASLDEMEARDRLRERANRHSKKTALFIVALAR
jgi:hypothetical protein